ncbi:hypothetical protein ACXR2U_21160 [Jatrophihabitans sp. YIM 134969]
MTSRTRRVTIAALTLLFTAGTAFVGAAGAQAAPTSVVMGDVTGDGLKDRVAFAAQGPADHLDCVALVRAGRAGGGFDAAKTVHLQTVNDDPSNYQVCPTLGVVSTAPRPVNNLLLAVYADATSFRGTGVYSLTRRALQQGYAPLLSSFGAGQISRSFGTVDFDGDHVGDFWQDGTDQGDGSVMYQRRGTSFELLYDTGPNPGVYLPGSGLQFVDLNHAGGTDALASTYSDGSYAPYAAVVDGRTGAVRTLVSGFFTADDDYVRGYRIATVDLNRDAYPDIVVDTDAETGDNPPRYFVNRSQSGRFSFQELSTS